jgi:hypothetical protein
MRAGMLKRIVGSKLDHTILLEWNEKVVKGKAKEFNKTTCL